MTDTDRLGPMLKHSPTCEWLRRRCNCGAAARDAAPPEPPVAYLVQMAQPPHLSHSLNVRQDDCPACGRPTQADSGMGDAPIESAAPALAVPPAPVPAAGLREADVYRTTSRELFHGHHPMCGWTIEADLKACNCVVALLDSDRPGLDAALDELIDKYEGVGAVTGHSVAWDLRALASMPPSNREEGA